MENPNPGAHDHPMDTVNDTNPPTHTTPPFRRPERLTRATDDKVIGGVAGGLGRYFGIDPVVFRIAFVVLALAGGSGILLYVLAWLLVPDDAGKVGLPRVGHDRGQKLVTAVLLGGGLLILLDQFRNRGSGDVPVGVVLVAIGALVLWSRRDSSGDGRFPPPSPTGGGGDRATVGSPTPPTPAPPAPVPTPESFGEPPIATVADSETDTHANPEAEAPTVPLAMAAPAPAWTPPPPAPKPARAPRPPKPRSVLVPVTLSLLAVLAGGLALFGVSAATGLALALLLTGAALVVGAWRGRARWLIPVAIPIAVALAAVSIIDVPIRGGTGDARYRPLTLAEVQSPYRLAAGQMTLDLSALDLSGTSVTVVASVATGDLRVIVPATVALDVDAHVGAGNLQLPARPVGGFDVGRHFSEPGQDGAGLLVLRVRTGMGQVEVHRAQA
jgi:phage shock protein PspC (stress-responsive transcriptional regulator)